MLVGEELQPGRRMTEEQWMPMKKQQKVKKTGLQLQARLEKVAKHQIRFLKYSNVNL